MFKLLAYYDYLFKDLEVPEDVEKSGESSKTEYLFKTPKALAKFLASNQMITQDLPNGMVLVTTVEKEPNILGQIVVA